MWLEDDRGAVLEELCTCRRWSRVTGKLAAAIEDSGLLTEAELDELAESLVSDEVVVVFPARWMSERWEEADPADGSTRTVTLQSASTLPTLHRDALRARSDADRTVRAWQPPARQTWASRNLKTQEDR